MRIWQALKSFRHGDDAIVCGLAASSTEWSTQAAIVGSNTYTQSYEIDSVDSNTNIQIRNNI